MSQHHQVVGCHRSVCVLEFSSFSHIQLYFFVLVVLVCHTVLGRDGISLFFSQVEVNDVCYQGVVLIGWRMKMIYMRGYIYQSISR